MFLDFRNVAIQISGVRLHQLELLKETGCKRIYISSYLSLKYDQGKQLQVPKDNMWVSMYETVDTGNPACPQYIHSWDIPSISRMASFEVLLTYGAVGLQFATLLFQSSTIHTHTHTVEGLPKSSSRHAQAGQAFSADRRAD